jgi:ABC-type thiamin/hydroxymethylpyrimidine transport system permease subunit
MQMIEKLKEQWEDMKSWLLRNSTALIITIAMLFMLRFKYLYFEVIAGIVLFATVTVLISGYVLWVFTKIDFVKAGDNRAITEIFKGVCFITAAILIGFYFVFAKP